MPERAGGTIAVIGADREGHGLAGFLLGVEIEALQGHFPGLHLRDVQRPLHLTDGEGFPADQRTDGRQLALEEVIRPLAVPQELPEGDVEQAPRTHRERESREARAQGEVQELQRDVQRDPQDAELVGSVRRAASVRTPGLDLRRHRPGVPVPPGQVPPVPDSRKAVAEVHKVSARRCGDLHRRAVRREEEIVTEIRQNPNQRRTYRQGVYIPSM